MPKGIQKNGKQTSDKPIRSMNVLSDYQKHHHAFLSYMTSKLPFCHFKLYFNLSANIIILMPKQVFLFRLYFIAINFMTYCAYENAKQLTFIRNTA